MSLFNLNYTLFVALAASVMALFRVVGKPQFNQEYLAKVLMNNHGQNILYIALGSLGFVNYLFYSPIVLFFCFNLMEFVRIRFPTIVFNQEYGAWISHNKFYVYEGRCRLELAFLFYCIVTLPLDFMQRAIKVFVVAQFILVKYRINPECREACRQLNLFLEEKTAILGPVGSAYKKVAKWINDYAMRDPRGAQAQQQPPQQ